MFWFWMNLAPYSSSFFVVWRLLLSILSLLELISWPISSFFKLLIHDAWMVSSFPEQQTLSHVWKIHLHHYPLLCLSGLCMRSCVQQVLTGRWIIIIFYWSLPLNWCNYLLNSPCVKAFVNASLFPNLNAIPIMLFARLICLVSAIQQLVFNTVFSNWYAVSIRAVWSYHPTILCHPNLGHLKWLLISQWSLAVHIPLFVW